MKEGNRTADGSLVNLYRDKIFIINFSVKL